MSGGAKKKTRDPPSRTLAPTAAQIRQRCRIVQSTWTCRIEQKRAGQSPWRLPIIRDPSLDAIVATPDGYLLDDEDSDENF